MMVLYSKEFPRDEAGRMDFLSFARKRTLVGRIYLVLLIAEAGVGIALLMVLALGVK